MCIRDRSNLDKAEKDLKFYWGNDECPTCNQLVKDKTALIDGAQTRKAKFLNGLNVITDSLNRGNQQIKELKGYTDKINASTHQVKALTEERNRLFKDINRETPNIDAEKKILKDHREKNLAISIECSEVNKNHDNLKVVGTLLRDSGIKSKIISKFTVSYTHLTLPTKRIV